MAIGSGASLQAVVTSGNLYVNHRFGLAFSKPDGWRYEHLRTFADIRNEYEYATPDPELAQQLRSGPLPLVVVSQDSVLRSLAASVTVYAEENPLGEGESLFDVADDLIRAVSLFVKDFRLLGSPRFGALAHHASMDYMFTFRYEDRLGNRGPVRHRTVVVLRPPHLLTFNMLDIPGDRIDAQAEFNAFRDSIVLA